MEGAVLDWLGLAVRWAHVVTGIAWIGSSFYFMWLDSHLEPPVQKSDGVEGELWMVHSGAFYRVDKFEMVPPVLPETLHWFKWEAAFTGVTGVLLLAVVYYLGSSAFLIDKSVADLSHLDAVAIGLGVLVLGWLIYDSLFGRTAGDVESAIPTVASIVLLCGVAFGLNHLLSPRAAYIHVGALIGLIMVLNVWMRIIPAQRKLIDAQIAGEVPDAALGRMAKQRSVHNNYLTLPVIFIMLSSHYPMTYGHDLAWVVLILVALSGALVRHWFNLRNAGRPRPWPVVAAVAIYLAVAGFVSWPSAMPRATAVAAVAPDQIHAIVQARCVTCHSAHPTYEGIETAPKGIRLDTLAEVASHKALIKKIAIDTDTMPLGNVTEMTEDERHTLRDWILAGAATE